MLDFIKRIFGGKKEIENHQVENNESPAVDNTVTDSEIPEVKAEVQQPKPEEHPTSKTTSDTEHSEKSKAKVYNLIIVDESGSMSNLRNVTLSGINETILTIKQAQKEFEATQSHYLTLVTFANRPGDVPPVREFISSAPIDKVNDFYDYYPMGCTPLYDAMGQSLSKLYENIKNDKDASGSVTVLTDGLENASHEWNATSLRRLIEQLKELGWSFAYMGSAHNVKEVTDLLSIDNVVEFSHDMRGATNTWRRERSSRMEYYRGMDRMYSEWNARPCDVSEKEIIIRKKHLADNYYENRITPDNISELKENEIFVFGSNSDGSHDAGAARFAHEHFGARNGQAEGIQGQSYAIPTTNIPDIKDAVDRFIIYAKEHPDQKFLVTKIGCGLAGRDVLLMTSFFLEALEVENISLPVEFWEVFGLKMDFRL